MNRKDYEAIEEIAFDYLLKRYRWKIITTPRFAFIDGVASINNQMTHIIEFKSRNESMQSIQEFGTYLISYDKIEHGIQMSKMLSVPFILLVYLIKDQTLIGIEIGNQYGITAPMEVKETRTQKTIDGGEVIRRNAFIDIKKFNIL